MKSTFPSGGARAARDGVHIPARAAARFAATVPLLLLAAACGGGGGGAAAPAAAPVPTSVQVSAASALPAGCGTAVAGNLDAYVAGSAVQPQLAADPAAPATLYGVWEQDRWNAIGTRAIDFSASHDGGATWGGIGALPFSACGGGAGAGASYDRASDPSIAVGPGGIVYASALAFSAGGYLAGGSSAVLVSRSTDGGATWQAPAVAIVDAAPSAAGYWHFNDRDAIAADPASANVYLVWDRITSNGSAESTPTWLTHSSDGGVNWDTARIIYDPSAGSQTFNNQPLVLPDGSVLVVFTLISGFTTQLQAIRSTDHGASWTPKGAAITVAPIYSVGAPDPIGNGPPIRGSAFMAQTAVDPATGAVALAWQQNFSGTVDGIAFSQSTDGGRSWSAPRQVNKKPGVAAFDPAVHFGSGGRIAITYYDFRDYAAGTGVLATGLWLIESTDGGATWSETRLAGPFDLNKAPPADQQAGSTGNALFLGDQQGLAWNGSAWVGLDAYTTASGSRVFATRLP